MTAHSQADAPRTGLRRFVPDVVIVLAAWLAAMLTPLTSGAFWPVAAAAAMLEERAVRFTTDPISPLEIAGGEWVLQPWLPALLMWTGWEALGIAGLVALQGALAALSGWLLYRAARMHASPVPALLAAFSGLALMLPLSLRAEQFAVVLGALLVLAVAGPRWWLAPLILAVWANVHGSVLVGVAICAAAAVGMVRMAADAHGGVPLARMRLPWRMVWLVLCGGALLVSPLGAELLTYVGDVRSIALLEQITPLWRPLELDSAYAVGLAVVLALLVVGHVRLARPQAPRVRFRGLLPLVPLILLAAAAFDTARNIVWFALLGTPELAFVLGAWWSARRWPATLSSPLIAGVLVGVLALGCLALLPGTPKQTELAHLAMPEPALLDGIASNHLVLASAEWADYVHLRTGAEVVIDARLERYTTRDLRDYLAFIERADTDLVERTDPDFVLLRGATLGAAWEADGRNLRLRPPLDEIEPPA